ncbi:hypothetical protein F6455_14415 [Proteobacteria bacterium 005FR1]|nr:hypothetical protein [Proteobacteria bacterium 005FR1]
MWPIVLILSLFLPLLSLSLWRIRDYRADREKCRSLASIQPSKPELFDSSMVASLPEPAKRYFLYTIAPGTPLYTAANISMAGRFGMGDKRNPNYLEMTAEQILALPDGFVWQMRARRGLMIVSGSDSECWTRFWLMGLLPVAHMGGNPDHARSAFGRYVAEAVFWTPAALLPGPGVSWELMDENRARVTVTHRGFAQAMDVVVAPDGQPSEVRFQRWSNANPQKHFQLQPFGGYLSQFASFSGFRLPTHVEAGNNFGTEDYFPFFVVDVLPVDFPRS